MKFMHGVVETPGHLRDVEAIFAAQEREAIVTKVANDPECGEIMPGTGGVRKVRIGRGGRGGQAESIDPLRELRAKRGSKEK